MAWCGLRVSYSVKHVLVLLLLVADLALNTVVDSASAKVSALSMMGAQGCLRVATLFCVFLFLWDTFVFKVSRQRAGQRTHGCSSSVGTAVWPAADASHRLSPAPAGRRCSTACWARCARASSSCSLFFPLSFVLLVALRVMRGAALFDDKDTIAIWQSDSYQAVYVIHNICAWPGGAECLLCANSLWRCGWQALI